MRLAYCLAVISACVSAVVVVVLFYYPTVLSALITRHRTPLYSTPVISIQPRRLHVLLPINENLARRTPNFCKTLISAMVHGYKPTIINWDAEGDGSFMQQAKVKGVYQYLTNLTDPDDIVLMVDALDIWFQLSPVNIVARFEEIGHGVIVGADRACWPNDPESPACRDVPLSPLPKGIYGPGEGPENPYARHTRPRWANSGTVIGTVEDMLLLYEDLVLTIDQQAVGDQGIFNEFLSAGRISLDYKMRLFWPVGASYAESTAFFINTPNPVDPFVPHDLYPPMLYHGPTGEIPAVVHVNGVEGESIRTNWWGSFWWNKFSDEDDRFKRIVMERLRNGTVKFMNGDERVWWDLCPVQLLDVGISQGLEARNA